jgi:hypothetical protein
MVHIIAGVTAGLLLLAKADQNSGENGFSKFPLHLLHQEAHTFSNFCYRGINKTL